MLKNVSRYIGVLLLVSMPCRPALAQIDISGEWGSRLHEDLGYRGTGPALGEYVFMTTNTVVVPAPPRGVPGQPRD